VCLYINHCGISWPLVSYCINFFSCEDSSKHKREPWWPWTSRWRRYPNRIPLWLVVQPKYRSSNRTVPVRT
jgi:hypothetical protein